MVNNISSFGINHKTVSSKGKTSAENTQEQTKTQQTAAQSYSYENVKAYRTTGISNSLSTNQVRQKYNEVASKLEPDSRVALSKLLKSGILLNNNSNDGSSVLDNLHKIITEPRIKGLNSAKIAGEAINAINNPGTITQHFGDIPENISKAVLKHPELGIRSESELDVGEYSNSCVAASIEFSLAQKYPAEFARMAAGLSSEQYSVTKQIPVSAVADKKEDAQWLLNKFNLPYKMGENDSVSVKIQPDRNAIIRARVQTSYKDEKERSVVDVLMQSAFMNVGSQHSYNALNDRREAGIFNPSNAGLSSFEKNFTESIATGKLKTDVTYQILDETGKITGRSCDYQTMENQIVTALQTGENVIVGCVDTNEQGQVINGHEITITNVYSTPNGDTVFACNNTGNDSDEPSYLLAKNLLPKIHHAGLPKEAVGDMEVPKISDWVEYFRQYAAV